MPIKVPKEVEYEPVPVRELLIGMKDYASLMLDLAYFSVIYGDTRIAFEVLSLEDHLDRLWSLLVMQASLAVRDADDAESMVSVFRVANALDAISDAAADLAELVVRGIDIHESIRAGLLAGEEIIARLEVKPGSRLDGAEVEETLGERGAASILLLRRNSRITFMPPPETRLRAGDIIVVRGTEDVLEDVASAAGDELPRPAVREGGEREIAGKIAFLKNLSEVMVDLAFHSVI
ncbi:MAG: TrkA C-terminal domain-containing protein, partial [Candidatus Korarchaeota archaeon]|nr:TrkA C-terminal domain-containing protein [Candidatus Korarchaeota archaeon]